MVSRWRTPLQVAASVVVVVSALIVSAVVFGTPQTEIDDRPVSEQFPYTCAPDPVSGSRAWMSARG